MIRHDQYLDSGMFSNELAVVGAHSAFVLLRVEIWTIRLHEWFKYTYSVQPPTNFLPWQGDFFSRQNEDMLFLLNAVLG